MWRGTAAIKSLDLSEYWGKIKTIDPFFYYFIIFCKQMYYVMYITSNF